MAFTVDQYGITRDGQGRQVVICDGCGFTAYCPPGAAFLAWVNRVFVCAQGSYEVCTVESASLLDGRLFVVMPDFRAESIEFA